MYIIKYAIIVVFAVTICYIKPIIKAIKERKSSNKAANDDNIDVKEPEKILK